MQEWVLLKKNIQTINLKITKCIRIFFSDYQLVLRWMDPKQHQDCRLWHPTPWFENGCYLHWKHNCHSRIVQAHQRTIHRYVQAQGNKIIEWDFFLSRAFCIVSVTWSYFFYYGKKYPFANVKILPLELHPNPNGFFFHICKGIYFAIIYLSINSPFLPWFEYAI